MLPRKPTKIIVLIVVLIVLDLLLFGNLQTFVYDIGLIKSGPDKMYFSAYQKAIEECGGNPQLVYVGVPRNDGDGRYSFNFRVEGCGTEVKKVHIPRGVDILTTDVRGIAVQYNRDEILEKIVLDPSNFGDSNLPINISDWKISSTLAIKIARSSGGSLLNLLSLSNTNSASLHNTKEDGLAWHVKFRSLGGCSTIFKVSATDGHIVNIRNVCPTM